jgi:hypothetical protein
MKTYFKSFVIMDHTPCTTIYDPDSNSRSVCQTLANVLENKLLIPHTKHFQLEKRLCVSFLTEGYPGTYRSEGIIFQTAQNPNYCVPFDMLALTANQALDNADYYKQFLAGAKQFKFKSLQDMLRQLPDSKTAIKSLNTFRKEQGLKTVDGEYMNYNECCFTESVRINPIALIGQDKSYHELAEKYNIQLYSSISRQIYNK